MHGPWACLCWNEKRYPTLVIVNEVATIARGSAHQCNCGGFCERDGFSEGDVLL